jgi:hypothetical protein
MTSGATTAAFKDCGVGVFIQSRVACPGAAVRVSLNGRKIDRQFQRRRADARNRIWTEDLIGGDSDEFEVDDGDCVVERLADKQLPRRETLLPNARNPATSAAGESAHALGAATGNIGPAASNVGDEMVIAACRRIIAAERIGWRKHGDPADVKLVYSFRPDEAR